MVVGKFENFEIFIGYSVVMVFIVVLFIEELICVENYDWKSCLFVNEEVYVFSSDFGDVVDVFWLGCYGFIDLSCWGVWFGI